MLWITDYHTGGSELWRDFHKIKDYIKDDLWCIVGSGENINALGQPWYNNWKNDIHNIQRVQNITVKQLFDHDNQTWNTHLIHCLFSPLSIQQILNSQNKPCPHQNRPDRLIWTKTKTGKFSLAVAYHFLHAITFNPNHERTVSFNWDQLWSFRRIMPKIKTFIWKLVQGALPTMAQLNRRIRRISPMCIRCGIENKTEHHLIFTCPVSRATWFASPLAIRTEEIPMDFIELYHKVTQTLSEWQISFFLNLMWSVWKSRNNLIFNGERECPQSMVAQAAALTAIQFQLTTQNRPTTNICHPAMPRHFQYFCYSDGSWDTTGRAGIGIVFYCRAGVMQHMYCRQIEASSPFHAEVLALKEALSLVRSMNYPDQTMFCVDTTELQKFCMDADEDHIEDWKATTDAYSLRASLMEINGARVMYVPRKFLQLPHMLANHARVKGTHYRGIPSQQMMEQMQLSQGLHPFSFPFTE